MKYFTSALFGRLLKKLDFKKQEAVKRAISELTVFFDSGTRSQGLGLKRLRGNIWEIRASIDSRIIFSFEKSEIYFLLIGSHDEVRRFLKKL